MYLNKKHPIRESFLEKLHPWLAIAIVTLFAWRMISLNMHLASDFFFMFPRNWLLLTPFINTYVWLFIHSFDSTLWWMWCEIAFTVSVWMFLYAIARGIYYWITSLNTTAIFLAVILLISVGVFFILVLRPTFEQVGSWWMDWDASTQYVPAGGPIPPQPLKE